MLPLAQEATETNMSKPTPSRGPHAAITSSRRHAALSARYPAYESTFGLWQISLSPAGPASIDSMAATALR